MLRETSYEDKNLLVLLLPNIIPEMIPEGIRVRKSLLYFSPFILIVVNSLVSKVTFSEYTSDTQIDSNKIS